MEDFKLITIKINGIIKCIRQYTSEPAISNILDELENAIKNNDLDIIIYSCHEISDWYSLNINKILSNMYVYNKDVHQKNIFEIDRILKILEHNKDEYKNSIHSKDKTNNDETVKITDIYNIFEKFHNIVIQLRDRYSDRDTLDVMDEYDVQDLLHALLMLYCDDIRTEEWCPSYASTSSRQDFLLKKEQIVIETKMTRKGLSNKELSNELIIDMKRYSTHPDCKKLICFVYDPNQRVKNPRGFESDLSGRENDIEVVVIVRP